MAKRKRSRFGHVYRHRDQRRPGRFLPGWYVRVRMGGRQIDRRGGDTHAEAEAYLLRLREEIEKAEREGPGPEPILFRDFAEIYLQNIAATLSPTTVKNYAFKVRNVLVPRFGSMEVRAIRRQDLARFIAERRSVKVATRNRDLALLSSMFKAAVDLGYAASNPTQGLGRPQEPLRPVPFVDVEGQRRLVEACDDDLRPAVILALDTGLRLGELLRLEWRDVDLSRAVLTVTAAKNKTPRDVPFTQRVRTMLEELLRRRVVPLDRTKADRVLSWVPTSWPKQYRRAYKDAVRAANLPPLRFHDLRHVYAVDLVRAGVPIPDVGRLLGHKTLAMALRYSHHAPADAGQRARDLLEARRAERPSELHEPGVRDDLHALVS